MKGVNELMATDQSLKTRRPKSREVSSRFLSPNSTTPSRDMPIPSSLKQVHSPHRSTKPSTPPPDTRKHHRSLEQESSSSSSSSGFIRGLWPSSTASPATAATSTSLSDKNFGTLADHLGNERLKDYLERKNDVKLSNINNNSSSVLSLGRQRSCSEFNRFENGNEKEKEKESAKENHKPVLGGSMRYTGKFKFPRKSSSSDNNIVPGRLSIDENALYSKSNNRQQRDAFLDHLDSESDCSSPGISTVSSEKSGTEVSSKYLQDVNVSTTRPRRMNSDSNIQNPVSLDSSPRIKKFTLRNAIKRANSLTGYGSATSQWALSPGRSGSPPMSVESKQRPMSFSSLKPPSNPSKAKGMEKFLNLGLDLFKSKKSSSSMMGDVATVHQLRMFHNRLLQWRFANARGDTVNANITNQVENNLLCAWESLLKLQQSVLHKRLQLQKEKLQMKLDFILMSQLKPLESWGDMERQHLAAVSRTKECLHSVVCRVPLIEGAKMDPQAASIALRHASDLAASIKSLLASFSPSAEETVLLLSELAKRVAQGKLLMEECLELSRTISMLEIEETSLKGQIIQLKSWQQLQQQQQGKQEEETTS